MNHDNPNDATHNLPQANQPPNQPQEDKLSPWCPKPTRKRISPPPNRRTAP